MRPADDSCSFVMGGIFTTSIAPTWCHGSLMPLRSPVPELLLAVTGMPQMGWCPETVLPTFVMLNFSTFMSTWETPLGKSLHL